MVTDHADLTNHFCCLRSPAGRLSLYCNILKKLVIGIIYDNKRCGQPDLSVNARPKYERSYIVFLPLFS